MNKLYGIILVMVALLVLSTGIAFGVTYPTILQPNVTNTTQTVEPTITTIEPTEVVTTI